jgi:two-component system response regulator
MTEEPRVLFVEDLPADVELEERELRAGSLVFTSRRVETEAQFRDAIREFKPHLILCDYSLPGLDGMAFLRMARELCPNVPFIFVSGTMGEDRAVDALKSGAADYVSRTGWAAFPFGCVAPFRKPRNDSAARRWKSSFARCRRSRPSADWLAAWPTISRICSRSSAA